MFPWDLVKIADSFNFAITPTFISNFELLMPASKASNCGYFTFECLPNRVAGSQDILGSDGLMGILVPQ